MDKGHSVSSRSRHALLYLILPLLNNHIPMMRILSISFAICMLLSLGLTAQDCILNYQVEGTGSVGDQQVVTIGDITLDGVPVNTALITSGHGFDDVSTASGTDFLYLPGTYTLCVAVSESGCSVERCIDLTIGSNDQVCGAAFIYRDSTLSDSTYFFHGIKGGNPDSLTYIWDFGDGTPDTVGKSIHHEFDVPGTYVVCLQTVSADGCSVFSCQPVNYLNDTPCGFELGIDSVVAGTAYGSLLNLTDASITVDTNTYRTVPADDPDAVPIIQPGAFYTTDLTPGDYIITAEYEYDDGGGTCFGESSILHTQPAAPCDVVLAADLDDIAAVVVTADPTSGNLLGLPDQYTWSFSAVGILDSIVAGDSTVVVPFVGYGDYEVCLTYSYSTGCFGSICTSYTLASPGCDYELQLTEAANTLTAELVYADNPNLPYIGTITWSLIDNLTEVEAVVGTGTSVSVPLSGDLFESFTIQVEYTDDSCQGTLYEALSGGGLDNPCVDPDTIDLSVACPLDYEPVCGCDGITYVNECIATNYYGITVSIQGPCSSSIADDCSADFTYQALQVFADSVGNDFVFQSTTLAEVDTFYWSFGSTAQSVFTTDAPVPFTFAGSGSYEVCLTILTTDGCLAETCKIIQVGATHGACITEDCVFPGDVDRDSTANHYDALYLGILHGNTGPARSGATPGWYAQPATDWAGATLPGVNDKHGDPDGDGTTDLTDLDVIALNYARQHNGLVGLRSPSAPPLYLRFYIDSVALDTAAQGVIPIVADIMLGTLPLPAEGLHGVAFSIDYDADLIQAGSMRIERDPSSYIGSINSVYTFLQEKPQVDQADVVLSRYDRNPFGGQGRIGTCHFNIIGDIIEGFSNGEGYVDFNMSVNGARAIDPLGNDKPLQPGGASITFYRENLSDTDTTSPPALSGYVSLYPNPTGGSVSVVLSQQLRASSIEVYDIAGRKLLSQDFSGKQTTQIDLSGYAAGVYLLHLHTDRGILTHKVTRK